MILAFSGAGHVGCVQSKSPLADSKTGSLNARINDGKGNQVLRSSRFPGQWGSIPPNLEQEKRNQKAPPPPPDTSKATISFAALSLKESSIQKRAMERKGRNKLKQERAMAIATVERKLGLMQT